MRNFSGTSFWMVRSGISLRRCWPFRAAIAYWFCEKLVRRESSSRPASSQSRPCPAEKSKPSCAARSTRLTPFSLDGASGRFRAAIERDMPRETRMDFRTGFSSTGSSTSGVSPSSSPSVSSSAGVSSSSTSSSSSSSAGSSETGSWDSWASFTPARSAKAAAFSARSCASFSREAISSDSASRPSVRVERVSKFSAETLPPLYRSLNVAVASACRVASSESDRTERSPGIVRSSEVASGSVPSFSALAKASIRVRSRWGRVRCPMQSSYGVEARPICQRPQRCHGPSYISRLSLFSILSPQYYVLGRERQRGDRTDGDEPLGPGYTVWSLVSLSLSLSVKTETEEQRKRDRHDEGRGH